MAVEMRKGFHHGFVPVAAALCLLLPARFALATAEESTPVGARMADDGRSFRVTANGLNGFQAGWSATIERGGEPLELSSSEGQVSPGEVTTISFPQAGIELLFRFDHAPGNAGVWARAGIRNTGKEPFNLVALTPVAAEFRVVDNPAEWLLTGLNPLTPMLTPLNEFKDPLDVHEYGGFYRRDGVGFLFGPAGDPVAFVNAQFAPGGEGKIAFDFVADMSRVRVDPGETRWGQQVALVMEKPQSALAHWAAWVAQSHGARTDKGALTGWNNWNFLEKKDVRQELGEVTEAVRQSDGRLRPGVIQIEERVSPAAVLSCQQSVAAIGARFGLRLIFDQPIELAAPKMRPEVTESIRRAVQDGFTYLKIIYYFSVRGSGGKRTSFESLRDYYAFIRQAVGEDSYLLSGFPPHYPNRAVVGLVDASRIGRDAMRSDLRAAMDDVLRSFQLNGRWFAVDNDTFYAGTDINNISAIAGGWPLVRTWMSMVGLSCGTAITSDPWYWESFKPYWRNVEVMTPPATERTEVLDLCTSKEWPRLVGHVRREWGDSTVALLWNPSDKEQPIALDFAQAGMDPHRRYAVWSFWDNRYLGVAKREWMTHRLGPSASQHLVFTDLDRTPNRPVLIGSNLHIYCGAAEIKKVAYSRSGMEIQLTDAGAREGDLFIYSRWMPIVKKSAGCMVSGVFSAGENVWRINVQDRRLGAPQRVELGIVLPMMRQVWFWGLIALVAASLLFGGWRWMRGVQLQRQNALATERARIAQDLHDQLGADLTQIGLLSELSQRHLHNPEKVRDHLKKVFSSAHDLSRQLDAVIWAISPAHDTLDSFVQYLCKYAQEFLSLAGIRCRLAVALELPHIALPSAKRHDLFLATKEALHNVVRHANATRVIIRVLLPPGALVVEIEDDGQGMTDGKISPDQDGLRNMSQRLQRHGGHCELLPGADGLGTRVRLTLRLSSSP